MQKQRKITSVFGIVHPFYTKGYGDAKGLLARWKSIVDRVAWDPKAALYISPTHDTESQEKLIAYANKKIPKNRLIIIKGEMGLLGIGPTIKPRISKNARFFPCGEFLSYRDDSIGCVGSYSRLFAKEAGISPERVIPMADLSIGAARNWGFIDPKKLKSMNLKEKKEIHKGLERSFKEALSYPVKLPQTKRLEELRGFCTLPRDKWRRKR